MRLIADVSRSSSSAALDDAQLMRETVSRINSSDLQGSAGPTIATEHGISAEDPLPSPSRMDSLRERMNRINAAAVSTEQSQSTAPMLPAATERTNTSHMTGTMEALQQRMSLLRKKQEQL